MNKYLPTVIEFYTKVGAEELSDVINTIIDSLKMSDKAKFNESILDLFYIDILQMPRDIQKRDWLVNS